MKKLLLICLALASIVYVTNAQAQSANPHLKSWIEKDIAWILSNENPADFQTHLKEIEPFFTKSGFSEFTNAMNQNRGSKNHISYSRACVGAVSPAPNQNGAWVSETFLFVNNQKKAETKSDWVYDTDEADFLTVPPKTPTILDVRMLKPADVKIVPFQIVTTAAEGNAPLVNQVIYNPSLKAPDSCKTTLSSQEKMQAYTKIKSALERDLSIINQKIDELNTSKASQ